jgi:uncharacterized protein (DUF58 family)
MSWAPSKSTGSEGRGIVADLTDLISLRFEATRLALPRNIRATHPISGQQRSKIQGRGVDFSEVRLYQPGDDVRSIDWRVTARTDRPHTKLFQEEKERPVMVLIDQGPSLFFGSKVRFKSVAAARLGVMLAWSALGEGDRVGGIIFNDEGHDEIRPRRSRKSVLHLANKVLSYNQSLVTRKRTDHPSRLADALLAAYRVCQHGSLVFVISDFRSMDTAAETYLAQLGRFNLLHGIHVFDELERQLPLPGQYSVTDGQDFVKVDTGVATHRAQYETSFRDESKRIETLFNRAGGDYRLLTCDAAPLTLQFDESRGRAKRGGR